MSQILLVILLLLSIPAQVLVAQESVEQILARTQEVYGKTQSYHISGVISYDWTSPDHRPRAFQESFQCSRGEGGRLRYQRGLGMSKVLALTDGTKSILYDAGANRYQQSGTAELEAFIRTSLNIENAAWVFPAIALLNKYSTLQSKFHNARLVGNRDLNVGSKSFSCWVLEGVMEPLNTDAVSSSRKTQLWIDRNLFVVRREVCSGTLSDNPANREMLTETVSFLTANTGEAPGNGFFIFDLPKGAQKADKLSASADSGHVFYQLPFGAMRHFTLPDIEGDEIDLSRFRGKLVLLDFWATWCIPCHKQMSDLEKILRRYARKDIAVLGLNDETPEKTLSFARKRSPTYPLLMDRGGKLASLYGVDILPSLVLLDRSGRLILKREQRQTYDQIEHLLKGAGL